jgi:hypothetical protein
MQKDFAKQSSQSLIRSSTMSNSAQQPVSIRVAHAAATAATQIASSTPFDPSAPPVTPADTAPAFSPPPPQTVINQSVIGATDYNSGDWYDRYVFMLNGESWADADIHAWGFYNESECPTEEECLNVFRAQRLRVDIAPQT